MFITLKSNQLNTSNEEELHQVLEAAQEEEIDSDNDIDFEVKKEEKKSNKKQSTIDSLKLIIDCLAPVI